MVRLKEEQKTELSTSITRDDLFEALRFMEKNKTPGSDGLTKEFYEYFWNYIFETLYKSYNFNLREGCLSVEQRRGIIRLIPNKDKGLMFLKKLETN